MEPRVGNDQSSEVMQASIESADVGLAITTNDHRGTSAAAFDHQYERQQQQQQSHRQARQAAGQLNSNSRASTMPSHNGSSASSLLPPPESQVPAQNRVFGLRKDLAGLALDSAHLVTNNPQLLLNRNSSHDSLTSSAESPLASPLSAIQRINSGSSKDANPAGQPSRGSEGPQFSVEVIAPAFDKRGYPIFAGRGARIRGILRTKAVEGCEVIIKVRSD
jgi:hypothetical protein